MSIRLELEATEVDLIFAALQHAPLGVSYLTVGNLLTKIKEQGTPQLLEQAVHTEEPEKAGGTD